METIKTTAAKTVLAIIFEGGDSRQNPGKAYDYMIARIDGVELYAELPATDDEWENHDELFADIINQAIKHDIDFDEVTVNGTKTMIEVETRAEHKYIDDVIFSASNIDEVRSKLEAMDKEGDEALIAHGFGEGSYEYDYAPTFAGRAFFHMEGQKSETFIDL